MAHASSLMQYPELPLAATADLDVVYVDDALLVLNKPAGLLAVPGRGEDKQDCLSAQVQQIYPNALIVHRLDMATSGLMLMARSPAMQRELSRAFEKREVNKRYVAVVHGLMQGFEKHGSGERASESADGWALIDLPIIVDWPRRPLRIIDPENGKPSQTRWRSLALDDAGNNTRVELVPITGRSHQLRVHMQALGHPILGDALYAPDAVRDQSRRLLLHACNLQLQHPLTGSTVSFESAPAF